MARLGIFYRLTDNEPAKIKLEAEMTVKLYTPAIEDLWFREKIMNDEKTMAYNHSWGGTVPFPCHKWEQWYNKWIANNDDKYFYRYIKNDNEFVGEAAYHFDDKRRIYIANVIIYAPQRKKGYGRTALMLLCENAKCNGVKEIFDDIAIDNPAIRLFISCGFKEEYRTNEYVMLKKILSD
ncbi:MULTISPECIES: GNAT family N-acetyltransferase [unclassified Treponema]|uniref:GNAT family N-acetyltransferase n=1 Tax=unclassified Treponema TaxID=2638727 RepID=UPI0020A60545|nr:MULTISPECIES: GNAT family N-acetyltransferase [unclassified Treponema]